jgi:hypothetical protein
MESDSFQTFEAYVPAVFTYDCIMIWALESNWTNTQDRINY